MNIQACLIVCFVFITSLAERNSQLREVKTICAYGFSEAQWQSQQSANALYVNKAKQTFKTPSVSFIRKIIQYAHAQNRQSEKQQWLEQVGKITPELQQYSCLYKYLFFILAAVFLYWAFIILQKRYSINYYICSSRNYKSISRAAKYCLLICGVISLGLSIVGYREGNKTEKTVSNLVCNLFQQPKGIIRGGSGPEYDGFGTFIVHIQKYMGKLTSNLEGIRRVIEKMYVMEQMIEFGKQMSSVVLKRNELFSSQMNKTVAKLQQVKQKLLDVKFALHWHNRTIEQSRELIIMLKYQLKVLQNYAQQHFLFTTVAASIGHSIQIFYAFIFLVSLLIVVEMGCRFSRRRIRINKSLLQYLMAIGIIMCLSTAYLHSFIVPGIVWLSPIVDYMSKHQNNLKHQLHGSKLDLLQILSTFVPIQAKDLTQIYQGQLMANISQLDSVIRPYYSTSVTYFDQLFEKGIQLSKQSQYIDVRRIRFLQDQMLMKNILVNFQKAQEGIKQILTTVQPNGSLAIINPSAIGDYARDIYRVIRVPLFNCIYNSRWICGRIGTLLLIGLICLTLIKARQRNNKNDSSSLQKLPSQELQSDSLDSVS